MAVCRHCLFRIFILSVKGANAMSNNSQNENESASAIPEDLEQEKISGRKFRGTAALLGLSGAGLATGLSSCKDSSKGHGAAGSAEILPGQLDPYYGIWSGGPFGGGRGAGVPARARA